MKLIPDWREFIELLNSEGVRYLLIGGWAVNRLTIPRATGDIDFFVSPDPENEAALRKVLLKFGFGLLLPSESERLFSKPMIMLGRPPHRIDLISEISGVGFEEAWAGRELDTIDGVTLHVISRELLEKNKEASAREKDLFDLKNLRKN